MEGQSPEKKYYKIVIVDDIKSICNSIRRELFFVSQNREKFGFKMYDFQNPEDAIKYIIENDLDLLISDIKMPYLTGDKLVAAVKREKPSLPVIVITGFATKENILSVYNADPKSVVIGKPWEPTKLIQAVAKLLNIEVKWESK
jgi:DNA-binding NtrC family response regulator